MCTCRRQAVKSGHTEPCYAHDTETTQNTRIYRTLYSSVYVQRSVGATERERDIDRCADRRGDNGRTQSTTRSSISPPLGSPEEDFFYSQCIGSCGEFLLLLPHKGLKVQLRRDKKRLNCINLPLSSLFLTSRRQNAISRQC